MSTPAGKRPKPLEEKELRKLLSEAISSGGYVETIHARFDHVDRHIDLNDVLHGLQLSNWTLKAQKFDEEFWSWEYEIETETVEGEQLTAIVAVDPRNRSFEVLTRWIRD